MFTRHSVHILMHYYIYIYINYVSVRVLFSPQRKHAYFIILTAPELQCNFL